MSETVKTECAVSLHRICYLCGMHHDVAEYAYGQCVMTSQFRNILQTLCPAFRNLQLLCCRKEAAGNESQHAEYQSDYVCLSLLQSRISLY